MGEKLLRAFVVFWLLSISSACIPYIHCDGPYKGKVVELETEKPIEGAVVAGSWVVAYGAHHEPFCDATETLTNQNGEFELPKGCCWSYIFAQQYKPSVVVFKLGYLGYPPLGYTQEERKTYMPDFTGDEFKDEKQYYIIKLGKPKTREERELIQSHAQSPLTDETISKLPILIKLVNEERKNIGLDEVYKEGNQK